VLHQYWLS